MRIASEPEYRITQSKLVDLNDTIRTIEARGDTSAPATAASLRSLRAYANQLIEELCEYEVAHGLKPDLVRAKELLPQ